MRSFTNFLATVSIITAATTGLSVFDARAETLTPKDLVGTWTVEIAGGYGVDPKGYAMFDANSHFSVILMRSDIPKYASNSRTRGTAREYEVTVHGMLAYFGTYTVNGTEVSLHIEGSSFPNWNGTDQKRTDVSITGDEMRWTVPITSGSGNPAETLWKRAK